MVCLKCGRRMDDSMKFCEACGTATDIPPTSIHEMATIRLSREEIDKFLRIGNREKLFRAPPTVIMKEGVESVSPLDRPTVIQHYEPPEEDMFAQPAPPVTAEPQPALLEIGDIAGVHKDPTLRSLWDLEALGWWLRCDRAEVGPLSRDTLRLWLLEDVLPPHAALRHATEDTWQPMLSDADPPTGKWEPPKTYKDRLAVARSDVNCVRHDRTPAVTVCRRCHLPVCERCMRTLDDWICGECVAESLRMRAAAWMVEVIAIPLLWSVLGLGVWFASGWPALWVGSGAAAIAVLYVLLRDRREGGMGKRWMGLRVVDAESGAPCTAMQSIGRNLLSPLACIDALLIDRSTLRRPGEMFAGTRVVDTPERLDQKRIALRRAWLSRHPHGLDKPAP